MDLALRPSPMSPEQFRELIDGPPICPFTGRLLDPGDPGITIAFHPDSQTGAAPMVDHDAEAAAVARFASGDFRRSPRRHVLAQGGHLRRVRQ